MSTSSVSFAAPPRNHKFRRRPSETDDDDCTSAPSSPPPNLSSILQLRKRLSRRGLEVSSVKSTPSITGTGVGGRKGEGEGEGGEGEGAGPQTVTERFTHQTGQMLDVDKHMMAYIESEMQKRRGGGAAPPTVNSGGGDAGGGGGSDGGTEQQGGGIGRKSAYWTPAVPEGRGATLGKLHEVDLGEETKKRNIARTQEATRRLQGGSSGDDAGDGMDGGGKKKGKGRKRRTAQDIERDKLVEEVLKESRRVFFPNSPIPSPLKVFLLTRARGIVEMYTEPDPSEEQRESEGAADDRIAEKFRREFLDALMSRRRRRGGDHNKKKRDGDKKPRGPKLGGSRQARAAMRESQNAGASTGAIGKKK